ncbi:MAG: tyrosine-type recombinase/integrase [Solirubrobacterales bacterium]|nr:tyrosine-type recombinase/integrase [Solirubrobacterales bacterium]
MPRPRTGTIESYEWRDGRTVTWRLRVRDRGRRYRIDLGTNHEGWNRERARVELERIMGKIERGTWRPPRAEAGPDRSETVHLTASRWWQRKEGELKPNARADYRWRLDYVLGDLAREPTADIDPKRVDEFRQTLVGRGLSPRSVNMVLGVLGQVLDDAVEYGLLDANPARGRRRRMRERKAPRSFLELDMVGDLLDAAGAWEAELPRHQQVGRRALLALLCLAGPRVGEAIAADRGDFDLAGGRWRIPESKTDSGRRDVELTMYLRDELVQHVAAMEALGRPIGARAPLFPTSTGRRHTRGRVGSLLAGAVERANRKRAEDGEQLLPDRVTPHTLRRTFASLALAAGRNPRWVMAQLGHADARVTLSIYAQVVQRQAGGQALIWRLMRFAGEPETVDSVGSFGPTNGPTSPDLADGAAGDSRFKGEKSA